MASINFGSTVSLHEFKQLLISCGTTNVFFGVGEPGIGKSWVMLALEQHYGDAYVYAYLDCAGLDLGDIGFPAIDHERRVSEFYANVRFGIHLNKPVIIMLDEFTKAMQPVQNMLHPLLEARNARLGDKLLPPGSIVFLTGNMTSDNVGDNAKAHTLNRVTRVQIRKSDAETWLSWAVANGGINPILLAWVDRTPHCLASYMDDGQAENPYIFNPKRVQMGGFVSPRSLHKMSSLLDQRHENSTNALVCALAGTGGEAAARDIQAFIAHQDDIPLWDEIIKNPTTARVPESPGACAVLIYGAIAKIEKDTMGPFMKYLKRFPAEWQAAFALQIAKNAAKQAIAFHSREFGDWAIENEDLL